MGYSHTSDEDLNQEATEEGLSGILFKNLRHVAQCQAGVEKRAEEEEEGKERDVVMCRGTT